MREVEMKSINTIRMLSVDQIEKAKSDKKDKKILEKYNRLKLITFFLSGIVILNMLINMF